MVGMTIRRVAAALVAVLLLAACTGGGPRDKQTGPDPGENWTHVRPAKAGFKPGALLAMDRRLQGANSTCFAVIRDGKVAHDSYFRGADDESPRSAYSMTKSFTSVLVGIAADKGDLSLDDKASKYITEWKGTKSEDVTVRDLLSNTSGRHWDLTTDYRRMAFTEPDKTTFAIGLGQDKPPGKVWQYNNSAVQTLQKVLEEATGMEPVEYGQKYLFDPLRMNQSSWETDDAGNSMTFSGIVSTCLDLARFGLLMLHDGKWNGKQIVSSDFVEEATGGASSKLNAAYGLLWWVNDKGPILGASTALGGGKDEPAERLAPRAPDDTFWALGAGRQMIAVIPSKDIVAVRMGAAPADTEAVTPDTFTGDVVDALR
jgi:CubicO group peptidase (beta-lactamase class C family)